MLVNLAARGSLFKVDLLVSIPHVKKLELPMFQLVAMFLDCRHTFCWTATMTLFSLTWQWKVFPIVFRPSPATNSGFVRVYMDEKMLMRRARDGIFQFRVGCFLLLAVCFPSDGFSCCRSLGAGGTPAFLSSLQVKQLKQELPLNFVGTFVLSSTREERFHSARRSVSRMRQRISFCAASNSSSKRRFSDVDSPRGPGNPPLRLGTNSRSSLVATIAEEDRSAE